MKLTVLMDNHTEVDVYHLGEPAVSYWIEEEGKGFLFDVGYSDAFLKNAKDMGIDVTTADAILLSHGHNDHTGGLGAILSLPFPKKPTLFCHPHTLLPRRWAGVDIGSPLSEGEVAKKVSLKKSREPIWLTENLVFLGEIPRRTAFEPPYAIGTIVVDGREEPDYIADDTALAYRTEAGVYVITGCSHSGICNILAYAKEITGCQKILGTLGGFHLSKVDERAKETINFLAKEEIAALYPCHCTAFPVRAELFRRTWVGEVGVGLRLEW